LEKEWACLCRLICIGQPRYPCLDRAGGFASHSFERFAFFTTILQMFLTFAIFFDTCQGIFATLTFVAGGPVFSAPRCDRVRGRLWELSVNPFLNPRAPDQWGLRPVQSILPKSFEMCNCSRVQRFKVVVLSPDAVLGRVFPQGTPGSGDANLKTD
jgi:hypothetical protein